MLRMAIVLSFLSSALFAEPTPTTQNPQLQIPQQYQQQIVQHLQQAGANGVNLPQPPAAAPMINPRGRVNPNPGPAPRIVSRHYTHCMVPANGTLKSVTLGTAFNAHGQFAVLIRDPRNPDNSIEVADAQVDVRSWSLFDTSTSTNWGLGGASTTETKAWAVKMEIRSATTNLGTRVVGCTVQPVKQIKLVTMCFDSSTTFGTRP